MRPIDRQQTIAEVAGEIGPPDRASLPCGESPGDAQATPGSAGRSPACAEAPRRVGKFPGQPGVLGIQVHRRRRGRGAVRFQTPMPLVAGEVLGPHAVPILGPLIAQPTLQPTKITQPVPAASPESVGRHDEQPLLPIVVGKAFQDAADRRSSPIMIDRTAAIPLEVVIGHLVPVLHPTESQLVGQPQHVVAAVPGVPRQNRGRHAARDPDRVDPPLGTPDRRSACGPPVSRVPPSRRSLPYPSHAARIRHTPCDDCGIRHTPCDDPARTHHTPCDDLRTRHTPCDVLTAHGVCGVLRPHFPLRSKFNLNSRSSKSSSDTPGPNRRRQTRPRRVSGGPGRARPDAGCRGSSASACSGSRRSRRPWARSAASGPCRCLPVPSPRPGEG